MANDKIEKDNTLKKKKVTKKEKSIKNNIKEEKVSKDEEIFKDSGKLKRKIYLSFNMRLFINILLVIILLGGLITSMFLSFSITKSEKIIYENKSNIDYKVYLNDNEFYDQEYLGKGMAYVASLIDKINIDYNFIFNTNKESDINLKYKVMAKLVISSQNNSKIFYENEYVISKEEIKELKNEKEYLINKSVVIDYDYYNGLANKFKSKYAVNTDSYLEVYLLVNEKNKDDNSYELNSEQKASLVIPLSQQEINIGLEEKNINEDKQVVFPPEIVITDARFIILDVILFILAVVFLARFMKKLTLISSKKSDYDKYVDKLLRGYDRLIVNVKTSPNFENYNVIKVESFDELLDVRDNVKEPIKYYVIIEHQKCEFFITNNDDLYLYVVKAIDIDNKKQE